MPPRLLRLRVPESQLELTRYFWAQDAPEVFYEQVYKDLP